MKIAICGPICSGKTYLSDYLQNNYNLRKYAFGDKVKEIANDLFNMKYKNRKLLQTIADKMREIDKNIWAKYVIQQIEHLDNIIIEDLRFVNEAKYLQTLGFIIIKLSIDKNTQYVRLKETYPTTFQEHVDNLNHNSEQNFNSIQVDYTISSDLHLLDKVDSILMNHT